MAKYRLVKYDFKYDMEKEPPDMMPTFPLNRPCIFIGVSLALWGDVKVTAGAVVESTVWLQSFYGFPLHSLYDGSIVKPSYHLLDMISADNIDCSELEITGEFTLVREEFYGLTGVPDFIPAITVHFLEKI